ncbi:MAG: DUF951 domain-containing protein [Chloroflexi bacterium HGW-Chloroflexi-1]|nr:MAG: DUF951 domain-containing protein [Chloroflexi bacterium HGW-Chloroflexi-1]
MYDDIRMGDVVQMRKPHPCGSSQWEVVRLGADIGIRCSGCGRRVLLPRRQFTRQVKGLVRRGDPPDQPRNWHS